MDLDFYVGKYMSGKTINEKWWRCAFNILKAKNPMSKEKVDKLPYQKPVTYLIVCAPMISKFFMEILIRFVLSRPAHVRNLLAISFIWLLSVPQQPPNILILLI